MKIRTLEILINTLFWLLSGWIIASTFSIQFQEERIINGVVSSIIVRNPEIFNSLIALLLFNVPLFYFNLFNITTRKIANRAVNKAIIYLCCLALFCGLYFVLIYILYGKNLSIGLLKIAMAIFLFYTAISSVYGTIKLLLINDKRVKELEIENNNYRLTLLRKQLQPHFLFNALNNLLSLVDQKKTPNYLMPLKNFRVFCDM